MKAQEIRKGIYWVGAIDWNLRNFHGYSTDKGSSYNAFLVIDEKIALIDAVKPHLTAELIKRISSVIDPSKIDYVISNHVEMDHSGAIPAIMEFAPNATVVASMQGEKGLKRHFGGDNWNFKVVKAGDSISLGKRSLSFVPIPMVHWPDSMVSYMPEEKILFSNDAMGQHIASEYLYDDEVGFSTFEEQAMKYYANIVLPFGKSVQAALKAISGLEIDLIAPSHGVMVRSYIKELLDMYQRWSLYGHKEKAVVIYDTMWNSTEIMAREIQYVLNEKNIPVKLINLTHSHISDAMTDLIDARYVFLGSPTLNNEILPTMGAFLTYLRGLRPANKLAFAFGSYGWGGQSPKILETAMKEINWEVPRPAFGINYIPREDDLEKFRQEIASFLG